MEDKGNSNLPVHSPENGGALKKFQKLQGTMKSLKTSLRTNEVVPRIYNQLVLFVLDGSRSMKSLSPNKIPKSQDIHNNVQLVLERLRKSKNKTSFDIGMIAFSDECKNVFGIKELKDIDESQSFNSIDLLENPGGTQFLPALMEAEKMIDQYFFSIDNDLPRNALVLLMTDGVMDDFQLSHEKIEELKMKNNVTVSVVYLDREIDGDEKWYSWNEKTGVHDKTQEWSIEEVKNWRDRRIEKLKIYASNESYYMTTMDAEGVRNHMIKSISDTSHLI